MREFSRFQSLARGARFLFLLNLLIPVAGLQAKLGSSPRQCLKIYGAPTGDTDVPGLIPNGIIFQRGEYSITCGFEDEVCTVVVVLRHSPLSPDLKSIPREDISLFMHENCGGVNWNYTMLSDLESVWKTHDWEKHASYVVTFAPSLQMLTLRLEQGVR